MTSPPDPAGALIDALRALDAAGISFDLAHGAVVLDSGYIVRGPGSRWVLREKVVAQ